MPMTHSASRSRSYTLLGHVVTVVGLEAVALLPERLDELLGPGSASGKRRANSHTTLMVHREDAVWHLRDECDVPLCRPLQNEEQVAQFLEFLAYSAAIRHAGMPLLLHAGAVARRGVAVLLPNASGAGKTTLTLALASRGWLPLTDDICPLVEVDGELVAMGCRRCCHLRMPSQALLDSVGIAVKGPLGGLSHYYRPQRWGKPAPVRGIVIPRYTVSVPTSLVPITQAECLAQLAAMNFAEGARPVQERIRTAARLAARVPAFTLTYSLLGEALDVFGTLELQPSHSIQILNS
ncbi:MAG: hypothetical protein ACLQUY_06765 [Ktedonobacterales bacterium]